LAIVSLWLSVTGKGVGKCHRGVLGTCMQCRHIFTQNGYLYNLRCNVLGTPLICNVLCRDVVGYIVYFPGGSTPIVSIRSTFVNKIIIFLDVYVLSTYYIGNKASFKASATNHITPKQVHFGFI